MKVCERCGAPLKYGKRFCSLGCRNKTIKNHRSGADASNWKGGIQTYRRYRKDACERCGSTFHLIVHHRDKDRYNNDLANLETLCKRCHQLHHNCAANLPKGPRPKRVLPACKCEGCGTEFVPRTPKARFCSQGCWISTWNSQHAASAAPSGQTPS